MIRWNIFLSHQPPSRRGPLRRLLHWLGPGWAAAPWRRLVQVASLAAFLVLVLWVLWPYGAGSSASVFAGREVIPGESFLALDPLVSLSAAVAGRTWVWSLTWAGVLLAASLFVPRGFCGYLCPLGTCFDLSDWLVGQRARRLHLRPLGGWAHVRYAVLLAVMIAAALGVTLSGFVAAIPLLTRAVAFVLGPLQLGLGQGWSAVEPMTAGHWASIALLAPLAATVLLGRRFWCRCLCPTGAVFSLVSHLRLTGRHVNAKCVQCGVCVEACSFDAVADDFSTRTADCTLCQTCGGACPPGAVEFAGRWSHAVIDPLAASQGTPAQLDHPGVRGLSRRGLLLGATGGLVAGLGMRKVWGTPADIAMLRPPGSVPERQFLALCVRCGSCLKACPTRVLEPTGFQQGLEGLWTPRLNADRAGCDPHCNICGQVCPTGAIRALPLEEKQAVHMGLAEVNLRTCLPHAGREACQLCVDACRHAGHEAIEFVRVGVELDEQALPIEDTGLLAPAVLKHKCVGCGLCQSRCHAINVRQRGLLSDSAIVVSAGPGKEDRLRQGSYRQLRRMEEPSPSQPADHKPDGADSYLPDFLR